MIISSPEQSAYAGAHFTIKNIEFYIGLYSVTFMGWTVYPEVVFPALLKKVGGSWVELARYDPLPSDIQETLSPEYIRDSVLNKFSPMVVKETGGKQLSWTEKLALLFQVNIILVGENLKVQG